MGIVARALEQEEALLRGGDPFEVSVRQDGAGYIVVAARGQKTAGETDTSNLLGTDICILRLQHRTT